MKIKYKNSIHDLTELYVQIFKKDPIVKKKIRTKHILLPVLVTLYVLYFNWSHGFIRNKWSDLFLIFSLIIIIAWIVFYPKIAEFQYKKILIKRFKHDIKDDIEIILSVDQNGINKEGKNGFFKFSWDDIDEVKAAEMYVYIFFNNLNAIAVPNNAFKDEEERKEFLKIINENIKK